MTEDVEIVEQNIIRKDKERLDAIHQKDKPLVLAKKCSRCDLVHPIVHYLWRKKCATDEYPSLNIHIFVPNKEILEKIYRAEKALNTIGIHFDRDYCKAREWQFDWSLTGEHFIFDEETKKYVPIDRTKS